MELMRWVRAQWDRVAAAMAIVVGALALIVGWIRISDELYPAAQLPYILSGGLGGLFLLGVGSTLWLSADLRDEWRELRRLRDELARDRIARDVAPEVAQPSSAKMAGPKLTNGNHARRAKRTITEAPSATATPKAGP
jgi:hypothetical protein